MLVNASYYYNVDSTNKQALLPVARAGSCNRGMFNRCEMTVTAFLKRLTVEKRFELTRASRR